MNALEPLSYVHAFYEGGAAAFDRVDKWSDIDLYLVVDDDKATDTFSVVEGALRSLSPIAEKLVTPQLPWPGAHQIFYRLRDASEYLLIDLAVLQVSSPEKFLCPQIHGNVVFYFNKSGAIKIPQLNELEFRNKFQERLIRLKTRFRMFNVFVQKEINRKNILEAIDLYHLFTLASLVEILRMKYNPLHYDFKMRYVHYELPSDVVRRLEKLYFVKNELDLQKKYDQATKWFKATAKESSQTHNWLYGNQVL